MYLFPFFLKIKKKEMNKECDGCGCPITSGCLHIGNNGIVVICYDCVKTLKIEQVNKLISEKEKKLFIAKCLEMRDKIPFFKKCLESPVKFQKIHDFICNLKKNEK
jgi:hypothetical protein